MSTFIAEVKLCSPFGWSSDLRWDELFELAASHGEWVAVHTESPWGGCLEHLRHARQRLDADGLRKPLLAKGIHADDDRLREALEVADFALVVDRVPKSLPGELVDRCIFEPQSMGVEPALRWFSEVGASPRVMLNRRSLSTGEERADLSLSMFRRLFPDVWLVQASFIRGPADVDSRADAFIVGQGLPGFVAQLNHP